MIGHQLPTIPTLDLEPIMPDLSPTDSYPQTLDPRKGSVSNYKSHEVSELKVVPDCWKKYRRSTVTSVSYHSQQLIARSQYQLFKSKKTTADLAIKLRSGNRKTYFEEQVIAATGYCSMFMGDDDLSYCDDLILSTFACLYLIMTCALREPSKSGKVGKLCNEVDTWIQEIEYLDNVVNLLIQYSPWSDWFKFMVTEFEKLKIEDSDLPPVLPKINNSSENILKGSGLSTSENYTEDIAISTTYPKDLARTVSIMGEGSGGMHYLNEFKSPEVEELYPINKQNYQRHPEEDIEDNEDEDEEEDEEEVYTLSRKNHIPINVISKNSIKSLINYQFICITDRPLREDGINFICISKRSIIEGDIKGYQINSQLNLVFFTRKSQISSLDWYFNDILFLHKFKNAFWLDKGYDGFKDLLKEKLNGFPKYHSTGTTPSITNNNHLLKDQERPPIPQTISLIEHPNPSNLLRKGLQSYQTSQKKLKFSNPVNFGLQNAGNTCYINVIFQSLFVVDIFRQFFTADTLLLDSHKEYPLSNIFQILYLKIYQCSLYAIPYVSLDPLLKFGSNAWPDLKIPIDQQDASSFLYKLLDQFQKEYKYRTDLNPDIESFIAAHRFRDIKSFTPETIPLIPSVEFDPDIFENMEQDLDIFHEYLRSKYKHDGLDALTETLAITSEVIKKCTRCGLRKVDYETATMLHLPIKSRDKTIYETLARSFTKERMDIKCSGCEALNKRLRGEKGDEWEEKWVDKLLYKMIEDDSVIELLQQMSEFSVNQEEGNNKSSKPKRKKGLRDLFKSKIEPSNNMVLEENKDYLAAQESAIIKCILQSPGQSYWYTSVVNLPDVLVICLNVFTINSKVKISDFNFPTNLNLQFPRAEKSYRLKAWVDHLGPGIHNGHYVSYVARGQQWVECDDTILRTRKLSDWNKDDKVYMLFYEAV
ncbi:hypothetical protein DAMA08_025990 [Martiniozyma asiatica (nom. inval.)]|nr:hypothetical protein DAMA08_025990 [Martiniozyma asiatica]